MGAFEIEAEISLSNHNPGEVFMQVVSLLALAVHQTGTNLAPPVGDPNDGRIYLWIAIGVAVFALLVAFLMARAVIAADSGTSEMQVISNAIREGAEAFLKRQYQTIGMIALLLAVVVFVGY